MRLHDVLVLRIEKCNQGSLKILKRNCETYRQGQSLAGTLLLRLLLSGGGRVELLLNGDRGALLLLLLLGNLRSLDLDLLRLLPDDTFCNVG